MEVALAAGLVGGAIQGIQSLDAQGEAKKQIDAQQAAEQKAIDDIKASEARKSEQQGLIATRDAQEKLFSPDKWSGNKTIFTSPLGVPATPSVSQPKSLLGA